MIIVSALFLSLRDKETLREREVDRDRARESLTVFIQDLWDIWFVLGFSYEKDESLVTKLIL